jgi:large subunit ribosomal protein L17
VLVLHGSIKTTKAKAKAVQRDIDKVVGLAKEGGISQRRRVYARLANDRETTDALFKKIAPVFSKKTSGYTRIINLPRRRGDLAEIVRLEWTEQVQVQDKVQEKKSKKASKAKLNEKKERKGIIKKVTRRKKNK